jgi:hypothetical protein
MGIYQLFAVRKEQARLRIDLTRKPDIVVGFPSATDAEKVVAEIEIAPQWPEGAERLSLPLPLLFFVKNFGERSGHNLLVNYLFPKVLDSPDIGARPLLQGQDPIERDPGGPIRMIRKTADLHPSVFRTDSIRLRLPRDLPEFEVHCAVSMDDSAPRDFRLKVRVKGAVLAVSKPADTPPCDETREVSRAMRIEFEIRAWDRAPVLQRR